MSSRRTHGSARNAFGFVFVAAAAIAGLACTCRPGAGQPPPPRGPESPADAEATAAEAAIPDETGTALSIPAHGSVALGDDGGCLVDAGGGVRCWGRFHGVPLDEDEPASGVPLPVPGVAGAVEVAVGAGHACARTESGRVRCWGDNYEGQLGDGTHDRRVGAMQARGIDDAVDITAAGYATCAVRADGSVSCWGRRADGPARAGSFACAPEPLAVPGVRDAVEVAISSLALGCVRTRDGRVQCWSEDMTAGEPSAEPRDVVRVAVAGRSICALVRDGSVWCWGNALNFSDGTPEPLGEPRRLEEVPPATSLALWWTHACFVVDAGAVYCMGRNRVGELGTGSTTAEGLDRGRVVDLADAVDLAAGPEQTCARRRDGSVSCWGARGEDPPSLLGDGALVFRSAAKAVEGLADVRQLRAGRAHACAATGDDGLVWCWGANEEGQLGDGTREDKARPVRVEGLAGVRGLALGPGHSCALLGDGGVSCWGGPGSYGGAPPERLVPRPTPVAGVSDVRAVAGGQEITCAVSAEGTVRCWTPGVPVDGGAIQGVVVVPELAGATALRADRRQACGLVGGGRVTCVRFGFDGERKVEQARRAQGLSAFAGAPDAWCGIRPDRRVGCWNVTATVVGGLEEVTGIEKGLNNFCAVTADGAVRCWGDNETGQLGRELTGTCTEESYETDDVREWPCDNDPGPVTGLPPASAVAMADDFACARLRDGGVWCWGNGRRGQLGDGVSEISARPVPIGP